MVSFDLIFDVGFVIVCLVSVITITFKGLDNTVLDRAFHVMALLLLVIFIVEEYVK